MNEARLMELADRLEQIITPDVVDFCCVVTYENGDSAYLHPDVYEHKAELTDAILELVTAINGDPH